MTFDPPDPTKGEPLEAYLTAEYLRNLNAAVKYLLARGSVSGGPGIQATQVGGKTTLKATGTINLGSSDGVPVTLTNPITLGSDGKWTTDEGGFTLDCIDAKICIEGVETDCFLPVFLLTPP